METEYLEITGGRPLSGRLRIKAAKNAVLPMLAASLLTSKEVVLCDCPEIGDVDNMLRLLCALGTSARFSGGQISVSGKPNKNVVPEFLSCAMRSSVFLLGPLLSELGEVKLYTPGGCRIGARPIDIHVDGLVALGARAEYGDDYVLLFADRLKGQVVKLKYPSVGATENLITAATRAQGETVLIGAAKEPEIVSLCRLLRLMGADISGEGTPVVKIRGVDELDGAVFTPCPDRIVAATALCGLAVAGGKIHLDNVSLSDLGAVVTRLVSPHFTVTDYSSFGLIAESDGAILPTDVVTGPYPLFPTDVQAPFTAVQCYGAGVSTMTETVFENRFSHVTELRRMGADIELDGGVATVKGCTALHGADVTAEDLRGGAALVVAALGAKGKSRVSGLRHVDRGYEKIEDAFSSLGAKICRKSDFNAPNGAD